VITRAEWLDFIAVKPTKPVHMDRALSLEHINNTAMTQLGSDLEELIKHAIILSQPFG